jgi:hypothetical protein
MLSLRPHSSREIAAGSGTRLTARIAILAGAAVLTILIVQSSLPPVMARHDAKLANVIAPRDARTALAAARERIAAGEKPESPRVQGLVRDALRRDATQPGAIELRALADDARGDKTAVQRLFVLSDAISRRSLTTRLWLIQRAVDRGSVDDALTNFDIALRTSTEAPARLYPILVRACVDPALAAHIARRVDRPVEWRPTFLDFAARRGNPEGAARLLLAMNDRAAIAKSGAVPDVLARLVAARRYDLARELHARFAPAGSSGALLADPRFTLAAAYPFGWLLTNSDGVAAFPVRHGSEGLLGFSAEEGRGGEVASQVLMLAPGRYRLGASLHALSDRSARPFWSIVCTDPPYEQLLRLDTAFGEGSLQGGAFTVPASCEAQQLALNLRASFAGGPLSGEIGDLSLMHAPAERTILN